MKKIILGLSLCVAGAVICVMLLFTGSTNVRAHATSTIATTPVPSVPAPQGTEPNFPPGDGVSALSHAGGGPVTVDDVRAFVTAHGFAGSAGGKTMTGAAPTILQITLMTWKQAGVLLKGENTKGRVETDLVIYVKLQAPFLVDTLTPPGVKFPPVQTGEELFDVTTGNLIMFGTEG